MRYARLFSLLFLVFAVAAQQPADAQLKRLKKIRKKASEKVEERVEDKVEGKVEEKTDEAMDTALDKVEDKVDDQVDSAEDRMKRRFEDRAGDMLSNMMGEAPERVELGPIETGSPGAGYLQFVRASQMRIAGLEGPVADMIGRFAYTAETVSIHGGKERVDTEDSGTISDADNSRFVYLYPEKQEYWISSFEDMMAMASGAVQAADQDLSQADKDEAMDNLRDAEIEFRVEDLGDGGTVRGVKTDRRAMIMGGKFASEDDEGNKQEGKFYIVTDIRSSDKVSGIETYHNYQKRMAEAFGAAVDSDGSDFGQFFQMMQQNEVMQDAFEEAQKEAQKLQQGLPIQEIHYFVIAGPDHQLDLDAVLSGELGNAESFAAMGGGQSIEGQAVVSVLETNVGSLRTGAFSADYLDVPSGWTESAMQKEAMEQLKGVQEMQAEQ